MRSFVALYWYGLLSAKPELARDGHGLAWTVLGGSLLIMQTSVRYQDCTSNRNTAHETLSEDPC